MLFIYIYNFNRGKHSNLSKDELSALRELLKRRDIVFCKPDKGNGVVILDKSDYNDKLLSILKDKSKFKQLQEDPTEKREASLQRYLRLLHKQGVFPEETYNKIRPCGSNPSRIY